MRTHTQQATTATKFIVLQWVAGPQHTSLYPQQYEQTDIPTQMHKHSSNPLSPNTHTHTHTQTHTHTHTTLLYILGALCPSLSRDGTLDAEIHLRIQEASVAFGKLEKRVWSDRSISLKTKINVYKSYVLTTLLYSSETWTTYRWHPKWLEIVHQKCLRRILRISWQTCTPNTEVLHIADCLSIEAQMVCSQMRWSGHVVHMEDPQGALPYLT